MSTSTPTPDARNAAKSPSLTIASALGEICWLLAQSPLHRHNLFVADLEWLVMPPLMAGQYKLYRSEKHPVAVALWAYVSEETQKRLESGAAVRLAPREWQGGPHLWLIEIVSPFSGEEHVVNDLKATNLKGKSFKRVQVTREGKPAVITE